MGRSCIFPFPQLVPGHCNFALRCLVEGCHRIACESLHHLHMRHCTLKTHSTESSHHQQLKLIKFSDSTTIAGILNAFFVLASGMHTYFSESSAITTIMSWLLELGFHSLASGCKLKRETSSH